MEAKSNSEYGSLQKQYITAVEENASGESESTKESGQVVRERCDGSHSCLENDGRLRLELIRKGKADQIHFYESLSESNDFNARSVKKYRSYSLVRLLKEAAAVRKKLIGELMKLSPKDLNNPAHRYTVTEWLPEYAWEHESDHRDRIRAWLKK